MRIEPIFGGQKSVIPYNSKTNTFDSFVSKGSLFPDISTAVSKSYAAPLIYPEYTQLGSFKLSNTGEGKIYKLRNGHRVVILPKKGPTVINTYIDTGRIAEKADKRETTHLLEHLLWDFEYKKNAKELYALRDELSATNNAATADSFMSYYNQAPVFNSPELEKLIRLQAEALFNPDFTDSDIQKEQNTIFEETLLKEHKKDAYFFIIENSIKNLLNLDDVNSYPLFPNANPDSVKKLTRKDLMDFYNRYYSPEHMSTVIVGNVDDNTIKIFSKYFNAQKTPLLKQDYKDYRRIYQNTIQKTTRTDIENTEESENIPVAGIAFLADPPATPQEKAYDLLVKRAISKKFLDISENISYFTHVALSPEKYSPCISVLYLYATDDNGALDIQCAFNIMNSILQNGVDLKDLEEIKDSFIKENELRNEESTMKISEILGENMLVNNDAASESMLGYIKSATPADIRNYFKKIYHPDKVSLTVVHPKKKTSQVSFKGTINISDCIKPKEYCLPNNIRVLYDESDDILNTNIRFVLTSCSPAKTSAKIMNYIVESSVSGNTGKYCVDNDIYFKTETAANKHSLIFGAKSEKTMDMLNSGMFELFHPNIADFKGFEKWKQELIKEEEKKQKEKQTPGSFYNREFFKDAPWINATNDIKNLTLYDIQKFYNSLFLNSELSVIVTIPKSASEKYKDLIFSSLSRLPVFKPHNYNDYFNLYPVTPLKENKIFVEKIDENVISVQKDYKIIRTGNIKDLAALNVMNIILGYDDTGMLFNDLRKDKQITYGAYSSLYNNTSVPKLSRLQLYSTTSAGNSDNLKTVLESFDNCAEKLQTDLVDDKTLERAKRRFKSNLFNECDTSATKNGLLIFCENSFYGPKFFTELEKALDELTPEDIRNIAKYYFSQPAMFLISGNKEDIEKNMDYLRKLGNVVE